MTTEFAPLYARTAAYYAANPNRDVQVQGGSETTRCQPQSRGNEPSLPEMTTKALSLLEADKDGFVLQVEGASIDKRDHAADVCGQIGETLAFDNAIGVALDYQAQHPDTLVIVTADHSHTSQMTYTTSQPATGTSFATVQTVDNTPIRVSYGTADTGTGATTSGSQHHTGAEVPVWASGPRAADIQGTIDQTDIFSVLTNTRGPAGAADTTQTAPVGGSGARHARADGRRRRRRSAPSSRASRATTRPRWRPTWSPAPATRRSASPTRARRRPGRLTNGTLHARPAAAGQGHQRRGTGGAFAPLGGTPTPLLSYAGPVVQRLGRRSTSASRSAPPSRCARAATARR